MTRTLDIRATLDAASAWLYLGECANFQPDLVGDTELFADFSETCCTDDAPCPQHQGHCSTDDECQGSLVCGTENCDVHFPRLTDGSRPNCCVDECADNTLADWEFDTAGSCCTAENPCPALEGNCNSDDQCFGDLVCGDDRLTCPLVAGYPDDARCCSRCSYGVDGPLEVVNYPALNENNTHLVIEGSETFFQVEVVIPHQYFFTDRACTCGTTRPCRRSAKSRTRSTSATMCSALRSAATASSSTSWTTRPICRCSVMDANDRRQ